MLDYINANIAGFWIAVGFISMIIEIAVLGFGTIIILLTGASAIITGLLVKTGLIPDTWIASIACFGMGTGLISALCWKPLKKMQQGKTPEPGYCSDLIGLEFTLDDDIAPGTKARHSYSGISWQIELDPSSEDRRIVAGTRVKVSGVAVGAFRVIRAT